MVRMLLLLLTAFGSQVQVMPHDVQFHFTSDEFVLDHALLAAVPLQRGVDDTLDLSVPTGDQLVEQIRAQGAVNSNLAAYSIVNGSVSVNIERSGSFLLLLNQIVARRAPDGTVEYMSFCPVIKEVSDSEFRSGEVVVNLNGFRETLFRIVGSAGPITQRKINFYKVDDPLHATHGVETDQKGEGVVLLMVGTYRVLAPGIQSTEFEVRPGKGITEIQLKAIK